jgi:hypothetical protein
MDLKEIEWNDINLNDLAQDREHYEVQVNTVRNFGFSKILENS